MDIMQARPFVGNCVVVWPPWGVLARLGMGWRASCGQGNHSVQVCIRGSACELPFSPACAPRASQTLLTCRKAADLALGCPVQQALCIMEAGKTWVPAKPW